ncbi:MAG: hypothetical protein IPM74_10575 [Crocinitomicaceae bacterium]|nr:hypothetical protein [Crocinitomicaceae bacterium]
MRTLKIHLLFIAGFVFILKSCSSPAADETNKKSNNSDTTQLVDSNITDAWVVPVFDPPFENVDVPFKTYAYNSNKAMVIDFSTGSKISIPENAFEHMNGNEVSEPIEIKYREFHTATDIILSGINMKYNEGDTLDADFETAGMFEIRAYSNGSELKLKDHKKISVNLASFKKGKFNNYKMNEKSGNWEYIGQSIVVPNEDKKTETTVEKVEESICDEDPVEYKQGMDIFDLQFDPLEYPEYQIFSDAMWICNGSDEDKKQLSRYLSGFNHFTLLPSDSCNQYELAIFNHHTISENERVFNVTPVWSGKSYQRVKMEFRKKIKELNDAMENAIAAKQEADLWRLFEISGMGVYNCDRILEYAALVTVNLILICEAGIKSFFHITNNGTVAIKYFSTQVNNFRFDPEIRNGFLAILPGNKIGLIKPNELEGAYQKALQTGSSNVIMNIEVKEISEAIKSPDQVQKHMASF